MFIDANSTFALTATLIGIVGFGLWAETTRWGQKVSAPLIMLLTGMLLANLNFIPHASPVFSTVSTLLVPIAIPMLLFRADLRRVFAEAGPILSAFAIAVIGTVIGALLAALLVDLGEQESKIAAALTASYIGGGVNFVGAAKAVGFHDSSQYVAALSADALGAVVFLALLVALPTIAAVRHFVPSAIIDEAHHKTTIKQTPSDQESNATFNLASIVNGIALSMLICAVGWWLSTLLQQRDLFILIITIMALAVANFGQPMLRHVSSEFELGTLFMYLFFATLGAGADLASVMESALPMLGFLSILIMVHIVLLLIIGRWLKVDLAELIIASNACILGPATAGALAASQGWRVLITPGMLMGILGYSIGTFIGVAIANVLGG